MYDHGARNRNPVSTLWYGIDPLFEKYPDYSPYNYCAGNPVKLVDTDGRVIKVFYMVDGRRRFEIYTPGASTSNSNAYVQRTFKALNHIYSYENKNDILDGKTIIEQLCSDRNTEVKILNTELFPKTDSKIGKKSNGDCSISATIPWNPLVGSNLLDNNGDFTGERQSPSLLLLHELGHVYANLLDYEGVQFDIGIKIPNYDNEAERKVIEGIETSAAKFWGEGVRTNHLIKTDESGYYCTTDPTSFQKSLVIEDIIDP